MHSWNFTCIESQRLQMLNACKLVPKCKLHGTNSWHYGQLKAIAHEDIIFVGHLLHGSSVTLVVEVVPNARKHTHIRHSYSLSCA